jgi:radical SAM protein with 4Fe4S-binding SPASM domain
MDVLWRAGVPHLCFTGGEATLRNDLEELTTYAEDVGFVTGLLTNGRRLGERAYLDRLVTAGLDHVQITLESHDEAVHDAMVGTGAWRETVQGIRNAVDADLYAITNTTLTRANVDGIEQTIDFIDSLGIHTFACNGLIYSGQGKAYADAIPEGELGPVLERVTAAAERNSMRFIWYTPTQYCELNPLELSLGIKSCTAAKYNLCVEPDGQVIPCQSYYESLGHILRDPWPSIWSHPVAERLRDKGHLPEKCDNCDSRDLCGGGCPLHPGEQGPEADVDRGERS